MKKIELPKNVKFIIEQLEKAGYEAYAVGGCVRDGLLGRTPGDWDITTSARPQQVKAVFKRTIDTGIQHGTVTVLLPAENRSERRNHPQYEGLPFAGPLYTTPDGSTRVGVHAVPDSTTPAIEKVGSSTRTSSVCSSTTPANEKPSWDGYEVTTYRIDGEYLDGRHPSQVQFTPSLHEDLARRDFTINAMAVNERSGIVDDFGGLEDLGRRVVRAVGVPEQRFQEDALRMLRALRFSAQLGFDIDPATWAAVQKLAPNLQHVSKERIQVELTKLLQSQHPEHIALVSLGGLSPYITAHFEDAFTAAESTVQYYPVTPWMPAELPEARAVRWGVFLRGTPEHARLILRELKMDNDTIQKAVTIAQLFSEPLPNARYKIRKKLSEIGYETYESFLEAAVALVIAAGARAEDHFETGRGHSPLHWVEMASEEAAASCGCTEAPSEEAATSCDCIEAPSEEAAASCGCTEAPSEEAATSCDCIEAPSEEATASCGTTEAQRAEEQPSCCCTHTRSDAACAAAQQPSSKARWEALLDALRRIQYEVAAIRIAGDCIGLSTLNITGQELMALGIPKGPGIGKALHALLEEVLEDPSRNTPEKLRESAEKIARCLEADTQN